MKIFDFMKRFIEKNQMKQAENVVYEDSWREMLRYEPSDDDDIEEHLEPTVLTEEQIRAEQIEFVSFIVLNKENLKREDIAQYIQKKHEDVLLDDTDIQSLISISHAIEYEDMYGDYNIRKFIDDDEKNIVKLVDELVDNAKEEAKKNKTKDINQFVITDYKLIGEIKNQIENNNEIEIDR